MKKLLTHIILFFGLFLIVFFAVLFIYNICTGFISAKQDNMPDKTIYLWGDSHMYQGIDTELLMKISGWNIASAANHGSGVMDFLVFARRVPKHSFCIVNVSPNCLNRYKEYDYNRSGLTFEILLKLWLHGYSLFELKNIAYNNKFAQKSIFHKMPSSCLYPYADTITSLGKLASFNDMFYEDHSYEPSKFELYSEGINILQSKDVRILFVIFPWDKHLFQKYEGSPMQARMNQHITEIKNLYCDSIVDNISVDFTDSLCMYDLTHMNVIGARRTTRVLGSYINDHQDKMNHIVMINNMKCY